LERVELMHGICQARKCRHHRIRAELIAQILRDPGWRVRKIFAVRSETKNRCAGKNNWWGLRCRAALTSQKPAQRSFCGRETCSERRILFPASLSPSGSPRQADGFFASLRSTEIRAARQREPHRRLFLRVGLSLPRSPNFRPAFKRDGKPSGLNMDPTCFSCSSITFSDRRLPQGQKTLLRLSFGMLGLRGSDSPTIY
jgi:hypothetical protein